jgi:diguanylate cyclase (GGDEF)-like protein
MEGPLHIVNLPVWLLVTLGTGAIACLALGAGASWLLRGWHHGRQPAGALPLRGRGGPQRTVAPEADTCFGLTAREDFEDYLADAALRCDRDQQALCVLLLDIDDLSSLNETHGREVGDAALRVIAQRLLAQTADKRALTRSGGDEFLLIVERGPGPASAIADEMLLALSQPIEIDGRTLRLTASIGIASYPLHGAAQRLPALANTAMRAVKEIGGNAWAAFDPQMAIDQRARAALLADLRVAVHGKQLELFYQPKIDAVTMQITAAEALLRWRHPKLGIISPSVFIPLAERHGLISELGNWVIDDAARQAGKWRAKGLRMRVAINLSAYQMRQDDVVPRIVQALKRHKLHPERFTVEITESLALENTKATQSTFERLRKAGLHVAIDDFGAGQTSLAYLRQLPASELKMDMSLVRDLATSEDARAIAQAVITLAHTLNRRVVAEGVETVAQRDWLLGAGCDEMQGYLFAKPMTSSALGLWALDDGADQRATFSASMFKETAPFIR